MSDAYQGGQRGAQTSLQHLLDKAGPATATHFAIGMLDYAVGFVVARLGERRAYEIMQQHADEIATKITKDAEPRG